MFKTPTFGGAGLTGNSKYRSRYSFNRGPPFERTFSHSSALGRRPLRSKQIVWNGNDGTGNDRIGRSLGIRRRCRRRLQRRHRHPSGRNGNRRPIRTTAATATTDKSDRGPGRISTRRRRRHWRTFWCQYRNQCLSVASATAEPSRSRTLWAENRNR